jgi:TolA-binding protein
MASEKISFSLNSDEGVEHLLHDATAAGTKSASLHAKQIVMSHFQSNDSLTDLQQQLDDLSRDVVTTRRQIDHLSNSVVGGMNQLGDHVRQAASSFTHQKAITQDDLRQCLFLVLLQQRPKNEQEAAAVVNAAIPPASATASR